MSRLIETATFRVPSGFHAAAEAAAKASGVAVSEFLRQTLLDRLEAVDDACLAQAGRSQDDGSARPAKHCEAA